MHPAPSSKVNPGISFKFGLTLQVQMTQNKKAMGYIMPKLNFASISKLNWNFRIEDFIYTAMDSH